MSPVWHNPVIQQRSKSAFQEYLHKQLFVQRTKPGQVQSIRESQGHSEMVLLLLMKVNCASISPWWCQNNSDWPPMARYLLPVRSVLSELHIIGTQSEFHSNRLSKLFQHLSIQEKFVQSSSSKLFSINSMPRFIQEPNNIWIKIFTLFLPHVVWPGWRRACITYGNNQWQTRHTYTWFLWAVWTLTPISTS